MAWVVGMADDENKEASGATQKKKRKKQKASKRGLFLWFTIFVEF